MAYYEVFVVHSAVEDFLVLPKAHLAAYARWVQAELSSAPMQAGVRLQGAAFQGLRVISRPGWLQVVFGVDEDRKQVLIILVTPGTLSLTKKRAELIKRLESGNWREHPTRTLRGNWADFTSS